MSAEHAIPPGFKQCTRQACKAVLPATAPHFYVRNAITGALRIECACCTRADAERRFLADPERHRKLVAANKVRLKAERGYTWRPPAKPSTA